jgi:hypothetical protein
MLGGMSKGDEKKLRDCEQYEKFKVPGELGQYRLAWFTGEQAVAVPADDPGPLLSNYRWIPANQLVTTS